MSELTETEILDRCKQALGEARRECQWLVTQVDYDNASPRGGHYTALKKAIELAEGSARQMAQFRADARWVKFGSTIARALPTIQHHYVAMRWSAFGTLALVFEKHLSSFEELRAVKTGRVGVILPARPSDFLIMPDWKAPVRPLAPSLRSVN